ncbi:hypothetical protein NBC2815_01156 [Xanthomonas fragariae]|nr:hypothetical protein NBC2815_01156 [Xanthomonas fragariae]
MPKLSRVARLGSIPSVDKGWLHARQFRKKTLPSKSLVRAVRG